MMTAREISPFTPSQWQELEHQALIFKYMASGLPIPPDLLYTFRTTLQPMSQRFCSPHSIQWSYFQKGFSGSTDPEPGRCRRTDGKKWRCTKDAFQDSKYCEKHMHRSKNRSRKPVENTTTTTTTTTNTSSFTEDHSHQTYSSNPISPFSGSLSSPSSSSGPVLCFSSSSNTNNFDSVERNYRSLPGFKEDTGEYSFFQESTETGRHISDSMSLGGLPSLLSFTSGSHAQLMPNNYSQTHLQEEERCFVMGTEFKSGKHGNEASKEESMEHVRGFFNE